MKRPLAFLLLVCTASAALITDALRGVLGNVTVPLLNALTQKGINLPLHTVVQELCSGPATAAADPSVTPVSTLTYDSFSAKMQCSVNTGGKSALSYHYPLYAELSCRAGMNPITPGAPCSLQYFIYDDGTSSLAPVQLRVTGEVMAVFFQAYLAPIIEGEFAGKNSLTIYFETPLNNPLQAVQCLLGISYFTANQLTIIY